MDKDMVLIQIYCPINLEGVDSLSDVDAACYFALMTALKTETGLPDNFGYAAYKNGKLFRECNLFPTCENCGESVEPEGDVLCPVCERGFNY